MLRLDGLEIRQGDFRLSADWQVAAGERVAVIGPSGAGKSTLLMAIAGFIAPDRGDILWQGRSLRQVAPGDRPVSMLFQDQNLFPHLTIAQNLGLGLSPALRLVPADRARIEERWTESDWAALAGGLQQSFRVGSRGGPPWHGRCCERVRSCFWTSPSRR